MPYASPAEILDILCRTAHFNMKRDGELHTAVLGYQRSGAMSCAVIQAENDEPKTVVESSFPVFQCPAPFQLYATAIKDWFAMHKAVTAAFIGEAWIFPRTEEGIQAQRDFIAGNGPSPTNYEHHEEIAFVSVFSPLQGFSEIVTFSIERRPHRPPALVPIQEMSFAESDDDALTLSWLSSWLEECLPAPDDPR